MTASAGDRVLVLLRLRRAEAGLAEQLATIRAATAELEALGKDVGVVGVSR